MTRAIRSILVATDFSPSARAALRVAAELASALGAKLILFHAYEATVVCGDGSLYRLEPQDIAATVRTVEEKLAEARRSLHAETDVAADGRIVEGRAAEAILRAVREGGCDLVVMGTHGRGGLRRLVLGSVAEQVLRQCEVPVLVVREESA